jgi:hypothetical protein
MHRNEIATAIAEAQLRLLTTRANRHLLLQERITRTVHLAEDLITGPDGHRYLVRTSITPALGNRLCCWVQVNSTEWGVRQPVTRVAMAQPLANRANPDSRRSASRLRSAGPRKAPAGST